ncbi:MAG: hypothetical protein ABH864_06520 [archaeon]
MDRKHGLRLWKRDYEVLKLLDSGLFGSGQLSRLFFSSRKKCSERMKKLFRAGLVGRFQRPLLDVRGKPEFVYCKKGKSVRGLFKVEHCLAVSEFFVLWKTWLKAVGSLVGEFFFEGVLPGLLDGSLVPDSVCVLRCGGKELLFFVEVDCGTESLLGGCYGFADKFGLYADLFDSGSYSEVFSGKTFRGFRVLVVFKSEARLKNFLKLVKEQGHDFVLACTFEKLDRFGVGGTCWSGVDKELCDVFGK